MADHALPVDHHDGPLAVAALRPPDAVGLGHGALGMEIGQERIGQAAQFIGEGLMRVDAVHTDAQNLGLELRKAPQVVLEGAELRASGASEIQHVEGQHHHLPVQVR